MTAYVDVLDSSVDHLPASPVRLVPIVRAPSESQVMPSG